MWLGMSGLRPRTLSAGFIAPCLPTSAWQPPSGREWLIEIKWDGFRVIAMQPGNEAYPRRVRVIFHAGGRLPVYACQRHNGTGVELTRLLYKSSISIAT